MAERMYIDDPNILDGEKIQFIVRYQFASLFTAGRRVIDIGCAGGYGSAIMAANAKYVLGIDYDDEPILRARAKWSLDNAHFQVANIVHPSSITYKDPFDVAVAFELIEHIENPERCLANIVSLLNRDGYLILSTPFYDMTGRQPQVPGCNPFHLWVWDFGGLEEFLSSYFDHVKILTQHVTAFHIIRSPVGTSWIAVCQGVKS